MVFFLVLVVVWLYTDYASVFPSLLLWVTVALFVLGGTRMWISVLLARRAWGDDSRPPRWVFYGSVAGTFAVWGVFSGFTAAHFVTNPKGLLVLLSSAALVAGASTSLAPNRRLASLCVFLIAIPTVLGAMSRPEPEARAFALLSSVYALFLIAQIQLNWRSFWTAQRVNEMELARLEAVRFAAAKSLLLATMSHEVKTPMNGVIGMIELILTTGDLSEEVREYANHARLSALNLLGVLNWSKIEATGEAYAEAGYEPTVAQSFLAQARARGCGALEAIYDHLAASDGSNLIHFPIFNYNDGSLDVVREMLGHPRALYGLSDGGAHVGTICDASTTTFMLAHWCRDRSTGRLAPETAVEMLTQRNARHLGLTDRGIVAPGLRADLNLIDPLRLACGTPRLVRDLPAGGKRLLQVGEGYLGTWVAGEAVALEGTVQEARPGRLVRLR
jgi:signal transduction histidine kinase